jgi:hypothetical protein
MRRPAWGPFVLDRLDGEKRFGAGINETIRFLVQIVALLHWMEGLRAYSNRIRTARNCDSCCERSVLSIVKGLFF